MSLARVSIRPYNRRSKGGACTTSRTSFRSQSRRHQYSHSTQIATLSTTRSSLRFGVQIAETIWCILQYPHYSYAYSEWLETYTPSTSDASNGFPKTHLTETREERQ